MKNQLRPALVSVAALTLLTGALYPALVTAVAQVAFPRQAHGSLVVAHGKTVGAERIGQSFTRPEHFHPRPSAAGAGYDAAGSGGANLGPTHATLLSAVRERAAAYRRENGLAPDAPVPADAVTTSASGLDPHISPENARLQVARVAQARGLPIERVQALVDSHTEGRTLGFLGEPRVNVLALNLALERLQ